MNTFHLKNIASVNFVLIVTICLLGSKRHAFAQSPVRLKLQDERIESGYVADFDKDGRLDFVGRAATGEIWLYSDAYQSVPPEPRLIFKSRQHIIGMSLGDFDGDGNLDLAYFSVGKSVQLLRGTGFGNLDSAVIVIPSDAQPTSIVAMRSTHLNRDSILLTAAGTTGFVGWVEMGPSGFHQASIGKLPQPGNPILLGANSADAAIVYDYEHERLGVFKLSNSGLYLHLSVECAGPVLSAAWLAEGDGTLLVGREEYLQVIPVKGSLYRRSLIVPTYGAVEAISGDSYGTIGLLIRRRKQLQVYRTEIGQIFGLRGIESTDLGVVDGRPVGFHLAGKTFGGQIVIAVTGDHDDRITKPGNWFTSQLEMPVTGGASGSTAEKPNDGQRKNAVDSVLGASALNTIGSIPFVTGPGTIGQDSGMAWNNSLKSLLLTSAAGHRIRWSGVNPNPYAPMVDFETAYTNSWGFRLDQFANPWVRFTFNLIYSGPGTNPISHTHLTQQPVPGFQSAFNINLTSGNGFVITHNNANSTSVIQAVRISNFRDTPEMSLGALGGSGRFGIGIDPGIGPNTSALIIREGAGQGSQASVDIRTSSNLSYFRLASQRLYLGTNGTIDNSSKMQIDNGTSPFSVGLVAATTSQNTALNALPVAVLWNRSSNLNTGVGLRLNGNSQLGLAMPLAQVSAQVAPSPNGSTEGRLSLSTATNGGSLVTPLVLTPLGAQISGSLSVTGPVSVGSVATGGIISANGFSSAGRTGVTGAFSCGPPKTMTLTITAGLITAANCQ